MKSSYLRDFYNNYIIYLIFEEDPSGISSLQYTIRVGAVVKNYVVFEQTSTTLRKSILSGLSSLLTLAKQCCPLQLRIFNSYKWTATPVIVTLV